MGFLFVLRFLSPSEPQDHSTLVVEIARQIHETVESPLLSQSSLDEPIRQLDSLEFSCVEMERKLLSSLPACDPKPQTLLLEECIILRLEELVLYRRGCERSLHSALNDPLRDNPLAGAIEVSCMPPPSAAGILDSPEIASLRHRLSELQKENQSRLSEDTMRRRHLFSEGARCRWAEARKRICTEIGDDLKSLDRLLASSIL